MPSLTFSVFFFMHVTIVPVLIYVAVLHLLYVFRSEIDIMTNVVVAVVVVVVVDRFYIALFSALE